MKPSLHDRLYLRFGLFHKRWGHAIAYMIEFVLVAALAGLLMVVVSAALFGVYRLASEYYDSQHRVSEAEGKAQSYQQMLITCLNGGIVGRAGDEVIGCQGAVSFKYRKSSN